MAASFLAALLALALTSANSPNWFALITEVNPPEHRGTVYSLGNLVNGVGRAAGNGLAGATFGVLARTLPPPLNFAVGLAAFQVFFIPTGIMYWLASRTSPRDIDDVQRPPGRPGPPTRRAGSRPRRSRPQCDRLDANCMISAGQGVSAAGRFSGAG